VAYNTQIKEPEHAGPGRLDRSDEEATAMGTEGAFQKGLKDIENDVVAMGGIVEKAIERSVEALKKRDLALAHKVMADDAKINQQRFNIEDKCIRLVAEQRPSVEELREIAAVFNIIVDLERTGDYADGIAKITIMIGDEPPLKPLIDIPRMAEIAVQMTHGSLEAFVTRDVEKAKKVISMDNVVDGLYDQVFRELITFMMVDPKTIDRATRLIWVAHNLERAADRSTNICERVAFLITGKMEEIGASKY
jgi:phosphate transport system protein